MPPSLLPYVSLLALNVWEGHPKPQVMLMLILLVRGPHFENHWGRCYFSHFVVEKTKIQRSSVTFLRSLSQRVAQQIFPGRSAWFGSLHFPLLPLVFCLTLPPVTLHLSLGTTASFPIFLPGW